MVYDNILNKVLDKIKETIGTENFYDINILNDMDDK